MFIVLLNICKTTQFCKRNYGATKQHNNATILQKLLCLFVKCTQLKSGKNHWKTVCQYQEYARNSVNTNKSHTWVSLSENNVCRILRLNGCGKTWEYALELTRYISFQFFWSFLFKSIWLSVLIFKKNVVFSFFNWFQGYNVTAQTQRSRCYNI